MNGGMEEWQLFLLHYISYNMFDSIKHYLFKLNNSQSLIFLHSTDTE